MLRPRGLGLCVPAAQSELTRGPTFGRMSPGQIALSPGGIGHLPWAPPPLGLRHHVPPCLPPAHGATSRSGAGVGGAAPSPSLSPRPGPHSGQSCLGLRLCLLSLLSGCTWRGPSVPHMHILLPGGMSQTQVPTELFAPRGVTLSSGCCFAAGKKTAFF